MTTQNGQRRFRVGQSCQMQFQVDKALIDKFADFSGDHNPIHINPEEARSYGYAHQVAHGAILNVFLSRMIGMELPGHGAIWMNQHIEWVHPVFLNDVIELRLTVESFSLGAQILQLSIQASNQKGTIVMKGKADVKVAEKISGATPDAKKKDKIALVTGSSRGIGAAIARRLAKDGITVALHYLQSKSLCEEVANDIRREGGRAEIFQADMGKEDEVKSMLAEIIKKLGCPNIVVHGASPMLEMTPVHETSYALVEKYLKPYVGAALAMVSVVSPEMIKQHFGRFIFMGTTAMLGQPPAGMGAYVVAKEALWGLTKSLATELGPHGITAAMVSPGMAVTDFTAEFPARVKEFEARKNPMRRLTTTEDIAGLIAFLSSEDAEFLNGNNIPLAGGPA